MKCVFEGAQKIETNKQRNDINKQKVIERFMVGFPYKNLVNYEWNLNAQNGDKNLLKSKITNGLLLHYT